MLSKTLYFCVRLLLLSSFSATACFSATAWANESTPTASKFAVTENEHGVIVTIDGKPFASYVVDESNKPYLWPIYGPTGKAMTRAFPMQDLPNEDKSQRDHPHHRGLTFGHESVVRPDWRSPETDEDWSGIDLKEPLAGVGNTWHETLTYEHLLQKPSKVQKAERGLALLGRIQHREFTELTAAANHAVIAETCDHLDPAGNCLLTEQRRLTFRATKSTRIIDIDQKLIASHGDIILDDRKDAGLSIRVPVTMAVDSGLGGQIVNSDGLINDDAWSRAAKWCDYHGPVEGEHLGIAILNHPSSYRYPTRWHVRGYGLFTANPFAQQAYEKSLPDGTTTLKSGEQLQLRHRIIFHTGDAASAKIDEVWTRYVKEPN